MLQMIWGDLRAEKTCAFPSRIPGKSASRQRGCSHQGTRVVSYQWQGKESCWLDPSGLVGWGLVHSDAVGGKTLRFSKPSRGEQKCWEKVADPKELWGQDKEVTKSMDCQWKARWDHRSKCQHMMATANVSSEVRGWSCSSEAHSLRKSKGKWRGQASRINCVFIPNTLSFQLDSAEPTWFYKIKFFTGTGDKRATALFCEEIMQVNKPEFWGLLWLWKFTHQHLLMELPRGPGEAGKATETSSWQHHG